MGIVGAEGVAVVEGDQTLTAGASPPARFVAGLASWLDGRGAEPSFATESLAGHLAGARDVKDVASGLLTFALPGTPSRRLLWFRPERLQTVDWGGDPRTPVQLDPGMRLHPRRSFELWKEEVRLRSTPWRPSDLEAANELRRFAIEADLERQLRRAQEAVRARDDLVAVVSHDLKNPVGVIQMQSALLMRLSGAQGEETSLRVRTVIERIQRSTERINALIHDLLDLARIEAGRFSVQRRPEDAAEMMDEAVALLRPLAESKGVTIAADGPAEAATLEADRERIFQVLSNLIGNAVKFTPEGGSIAVGVAAHPGRGRARRRRPLRLHRAYVAPAPLTPPLGPSATSAKLRSTRLGRAWGRSAAAWGV